MRTVLVFFLFALGFLLAGCGSSLPYPLDYPLTSEPFLSRGNVFTGRVPKGWFFASADTMAPSYAAWVVRDDLAAALAVKELHLDPSAAERVQKDGVKALAMMSTAFQTSEAPGAKIEKEPKEFTARGRKYCGYELTAGAIKKRVVVFTESNRYFECVALPVKGTWDEEQSQRLFAAQEAFLTTLTFD